MNVRRFALAQALLLVLVLLWPSAGAPQDTMKMPPGLTPEIMKMMNTPLAGEPVGLPAGLDPLGGCIPTMGYHFSKPGKAPFGPYYGWFNGKPIFTEIMVAKSDFDRGSNWNEQLVPLPGYKIDHVDIWYHAHGHMGYDQPHYDIHAFYVSHAEHMTYCGNTSGKRPAFLF